MTRRLPILLALVFCWLMAIGAIVTAVQSWRFLRSAVPAVGTVVALRETGGGVDSTWAPVVEFTNQVGVTFSVNSRMSSAPPAHRVGDRLAVLYLPNHPESARVDHPAEFWMAPIVFSFLSFSCGVLAVAIRSRS